MTRQHWLPAALWQQPWLSMADWGLATNSLRCRDRVHRMHSHQEVGWKNGSADSDSFWMLFLWKSHYGKSCHLARNLFQGAAASAPGSPSFLPGLAWPNAPGQLPRAISPHPSLAQPCHGPTCTPRSWASLTHHPSALGCNVLAGVAGWPWLWQTPGTQWQGVVVELDNLLEHHWCQFKRESLPFSTEADQERPFLRGHFLFINYNLINWKD